MTDTAKALIDHLNNLKTGIVGDLTKVVIANGLENQKLLMGIEVKINELQIAISKLEPKTKQPKPVAPVDPAAPAPAPAPAKTTAPNILSYFKQQYVADADFRAKFHDAACAEAIMKQEAYTKKTGDSKLKHMAGEMYKCLRSGATDALKALNKEMEAKFNEYKTANAAPANTLAADPPSPKA